MNIQEKIELLKQLKTDYEKCGEMINIEQDGFMLSAIECAQIELKNRIFELINDINTECQNIINLNNADLVKLKEVKNEI